MCWCNDENAIDILKIVDQVIPVLGPNVSMKNSHMLYFTTENFQANILRDISGV
jgi:hypothetical protein